MTDIDAILIAGPTASGKSGLALQLAKAHGGVVVNADSMQVYEGLRLLTARPSCDEEALVPHKLYGFVDPADAYSAGRWGEDVGRVLEDCASLGKLPIIVGGTGLYFNVLLKGLSPVPEVCDEVRQKWREAARDMGGEALHEKLRSVDPVMAKTLRPSDPQRIVRALEVFEATGKSLDHWQSLPGAPLIDFAKTKSFVVSPDRERLYERCNRRFDQMLDEGALEEVVALQRRSLSPELPIMGALGVRPLVKYLANEVSLEEAAELSKRDTRRYAKRQMTWLRGNMLAWNWLSEQDMERLRRNKFAF